MRDGLAREFCAKDGFEWERMMQSGLDHYYRLTDIALNYIAVNTPAVEPPVIMEVQTNASEVS